MSRLADDPKPREEDLIAFVFDEDGIDVREERGSGAVFEAKHDVEDRELVELLDALVGTETPEDEAILTLVGETAPRDGPPPAGVPRGVMSGAVWFGAIPLGLVAALAIFLFIGWLQPSLTSGERITLPALVRFRMAKTEEKAPERKIEKQRTDEPKRRVRKRPVVRRRSTPRAQVKASRRLHAGMNMLASMMPAGAATAGVLNMEFNPQDAAIDSGSLKDRDVVELAQRRARQDRLRTLSDREGGFANGGVFSQVTPPRLLYRVPPEYPAEAEKKQLEGYVVVKVLISTVGDVKEVEIVAAQPEGYFEEAVVDALGGWRFSPAKDKDGNPYEVYDRFKINFKLKAAP
jgi:protein TonB